MSLKAFHIFFIALAALCSFGFGVWMLIADIYSTPVNLAGAGASFLCTMGLIWYGRRFLKKFKSISFM